MFFGGHQSRLKKIERENADTDLISPLLVVSPKSHLVLKGHIWLHASGMMCQSMIIFLRKLVKLGISNKRLILLHLLSGSLLSLHLPKLDSSGIFRPAFSISLHWAELLWRSTQPPHSMSSGMLLLQFFVNSPTAQQKVSGYLCCGH